MKEQSIRQYLKATKKHLLEQIIPLCFMFEDFHYFENPQYTYKVKSKTYTFYGFK